MSFPDSVCSFQPSTTDSDTSEFEDVYKDYFVKGLIAQNENTIKLVCRKSGDIDILVEVIKCVSLKKLFFGRAHWLCSDYHQHELQPGDRIFFHVTTQARKRLLKENKLLINHDLNLKTRDIVILAYSGVDRTLIEDKIKEQNLDFMMVSLWMPLKAVFEWPATARLQRVQLETDAKWLRIITLEKELERLKRKYGELKTESDDDVKDDQSDDVERKKVLSKVAFKYCTKPNLFPP